MKFGENYEGIRLLYIVFGFGYLISDQRLKTGPEAILLNRHKGGGSNV